MDVLKVSGKAISSGLVFMRPIPYIWICKGFVSTTSPSHKSKVDKETCEKVIEAADTVKEGTKTVVSEVKRIGQVVTDKVANATTNMMADAAKKGLEKAADTSDTQRGKDVLDTAKVATEAFKNKVVDK